MKTTTVTKQSKKDLKREQELKDKARAEELILAYEELVREHEAKHEQLKDKLKPFQEEFDRQADPVKTLLQDKISGLEESIEAAKEELLEIGERNKQFFAVDGNWKFDNGFYMHIAKESVPVFGEDDNGNKIKEPGEDFDLGKYVKKFRDYVKVGFRIKELKALFLDGDAKERKQMIDMGFDLDVEETFEVKESKRAREPKD